MQQTQIPPDSKNTASPSIRPLLLAALVITCISACSTGTVCEQHVRIPAEGWNSTERARFEVNITDITSPCNVYINVRNNAKYRYMELWLFVSILSPAGAVDRDTVKIMLADHRGKWMGHGLGSKFDTRLLFRRNAQFPVAGKYIFEYAQASRDSLLIGIDDMGLSIEKSETGQP